MSSLARSNPEHVLGQEAGSRATPCSAPTAPVCSATELAAASSTPLPQARPPVVALAKAGPVANSRVFPSHAAVHVQHVRLTTQDYSGKTHMV